MFEEEKISSRNICILKICISTIFIISVPWPFWLSVSKSLLAVMHGCFFVYFNHVKSKIFLSIFVFLK